MDAKKINLFCCLFLTFCIKMQGQIGSFTSISPIGQTTNFVIPTGFRFQKIIQTGDPLTLGGLMAGNHDFTGYVPIMNSSVLGKLSINQENSPGGVVVLDIGLNANKLWETTSSGSVDFSGVGGTARNCSGSVTPWNTIMTCEEAISTDNNMDGYNDLGWCVEIDPATRMVLGKRWAMGNFNHENVIVHSNKRTVYEGSDSNPGYLYKFVANTAEDLSSGLLYVYSGSKNGSGIWLPIGNTTKTERNTTIAQSTSLGATVFNGIEDVEIGPDGLIYFAVKNENRVYRFQDSDPIVGTQVPMMETFVGNTTYNITSEGGTTPVSWGTGNDNLAFDGDGNLWVLQDGSLNYIWVVESGHTQASPKVKIFGSTPLGSEPTGITFSPDFKYLFMSIQHPSSSNNATSQLDAAGNVVYFNKNISLVIARSENLGCPVQGTACDDGQNNTYNDVEDGNCNCLGTKSVDTIYISVAGNANDVEENQAGGAISALSSDLEMVHDVAQNSYQKIGVRFQGLLIPAGAIVTNAYIQFVADVSDTESTSLLISGHKVANSPPYSLGAFELTNRPKTSAVVNWANIGPWAINESGPSQKTPNLSRIVNEIISEIGWTSGNAMDFVIEGTGKRSAISADDGPATSPKLFLEFLIPNVNNVGIGTTNPKAKLEVNQGDVYIKTPKSGIIMKSEDGNCWKLLISNSGVVSTVGVDCPD